MLHSYQHPHIDMNEKSAILSGQLIMDMRSENHDDQDEKTHTALLTSTTSFHLDQLAIFYFPPYILFSSSCKKRALFPSFVGK